jgi:hypothetical protein
MKYCIEEHNKLVEEIKPILGPLNFSTILDFQPHPGYVADIGVRKGGNMLGLQRSKRNKVFYAAGVIFIHPESSEDLYPQVYQKVAAMTRRVEAFAESVGSNEEFVYLPYADSTQDPIGSYGADNVKYLKEMSKKYDPDGFFQRMVPGGFKVNRVK